MLVGLKSTISSLLIVKICFWDIHSRALPLGDYIYYNVLWGAGCCEWGREALVNCPLEAVCSRSLSLKRENKPMKLASTRCEPVSLVCSSLPTHLEESLLVLVTILSKSFLALMRSHLVAFSFLSAWHCIEY